MSWMLLRFTLDRRVRNFLPKDKIYNSYMDQWWGVGRAVTFGWCAVIPNKKHSDVVAYYYNGINIYRFANTFEKIIAYCLVGGMAIMILTGVPYYFISEQ